ncbi:MAG TPA: hypothetical protein VNP72_04625, partial [Longimicrobium sp.]|nr:hypothetical protein [Longimicrobium sp.]
DVCVVEGMGHLEFVRTAPQIRAGRHVDNPHVTYRKVRRLTVESDEEMTVNADGEPLCGRRFDYDLGEHRLTLSVPIRPIDGAAPGHEPAGEREA